jgi:hypothetical protein
MVRRLVEALQPERIYLFGSRARGDARDDSDYDLLVVVRERSGPGYHTEQQAYSAVGGIGVPTEIVVVTRERFDWLRTAAASLPATVEREGRLLYAARAVSPTRPARGRPRAPYPRTAREDQP